MVRPIFRLLASPTLFFGLLTVAVTMPQPAQAQPADLALMAIAEVSSPTAICHANDGSDRLFLVDRSGFITIHDLRTGQTLGTPFLDISTLVDSSGGEQGLLGLAFHPDFRTNGRFFVSYTVDPGAGLDRSRVAEYNVTANPNVADLGSVFTILEVEQDFDNHNGGDLHFGPDGYLYLGLGDGGSANDPNDRSQNPNSLLGKMLRLDIDVVPLRQDATRGAQPICGLVANYGIPADNPCVADTGFCTGITGCQEIWSMGLRNPWRFSFDRLNGDLWIGDVGQNTLEEIDRQPAASIGGENYGWSCMEGTNTPNFNACLAGALTPPVLEYSHTGPVFCSGSVTGGFRYRGSMPSLDGLYMYADYCAGDVFFGDETGGWSATTWATNVPEITTFGEDEAGELYIGRIDGTISTLTSAERAFFFDGFESGTILRWSASMP
ncbi:MAG: PQQ-dependent sugar dehydrogenase [Acidobacteriota bacterium]